jgi:hypothetical protein
MIVVLSTCSEAHSKGPHILEIATADEKRRRTIQNKSKIPNKLEFDLLEDFGFAKCLKAGDTECISIVPASTDAWSLTSVVTLVLDSCGKVKLLTYDIDIDFSADTTGEMELF